MIKDHFSSFVRYSTPYDIMNHMSTKLGVNVSYYKAWRVKKLVMNSLNGEEKKLCLEFRRGSVGVERS